MKIRKFRKSLALIFVFTFIVTSLGIAQVDDSKKNPDGTYSSKKFNEAERPVDSYLSKFYAIDIVEKLNKRNLEQVYLLNVIVSNFQDKGWKDEYNKTYEGYKVAMELYFKRNLIYSRYEFENNRKAISDLLKKIALDFQKDTQEMLSECATKILALHLDRRTKSDPNKFKELIKNKMRLKIAFGQFDDGESSFIDRKFEVSIYHYRISKTYAIRILEDLAKPEERDSVKDKYKFHKADNLNRIFEAKSAAPRTETKDTKEKAGE